MLVAAGANVYAEDNRNRSPLSWCGKAVHDAMLQQSALYLLFLFTRGMMWWQGNKTSTIGLAGTSSQQCSKNQSL